MIKQGDTFWISSLEEDVDNHLCIVISDSIKNPDKVVLVAFTTWESYKDDSCILEAGDHPFVKHPTCVKYDGKQELLSVSQLEKLLDEGKIKRREPVSESILQEILRGAAESKHIPMGHWKILNDQGFVE